MVCLVVVCLCLCVCVRNDVFMCVYLRDVVWCAVVYGVLFGCIAVCVRRL